MAAVYDGRAVHPWRGFAPPPDFAYSAVESDLRAMRSAVDALSRELSRASALLGAGTSALSLSRLEDVASRFKRLAEARALPRDWAHRSIEEVGAAATLLAEASASAIRRTELRITLAAAMRSSAAETQTLLAPVDTEFRSGLRYLQPSFWRWRSAVRAKLRPEAASSRAALLSYLETAIAITTIDAWFGSSGR